MCCDQKHFEVKGCFFKFSNCLAFPENYFYIVRGSLLLTKTPCMKNLILVFIAALLSITGFCQSDMGKIKDLPSFNNRSTVNFLRPIPPNPGFLTLTNKPKWDAKCFNDEYNQLLIINKQKQLYPILLIDNRFVNQAAPARYSSQNYMWVSTQPQHQAFGETIANDIISSFVNSKTKKYGLNFKPAEKGYYTPVGRKY